MEGEAQSHTRHTGPLESGAGLPAQLWVPGLGEEKSREDGAPASSGAPHLLVVLLQALVIFAQRGQVDEGDHVLKAVDPLLAF